MPVWKAALALTACSLVSAMPPQVYAVPDDPRIVMVECDEGLGTAFRVGPHHYVSVTHVTANTGCRINGRPFRTVFQQGDFSYLTTATDEPGHMRIDCGGFEQGEKYVALGYARGYRPNITAVELVGTGDRANDGRSLLEGIATVIPGQSGGPILRKSTGRPVGTVNTYDSQNAISGSIALRDTLLCENSLNKG